MAELNPQPKAQAHGGPRQRKKSTRIDMTAMVDVAFLLLTFFILTTTLSEPFALAVTKPLNTPTPIDEQKICTIVLGEEDRIHYWHGMLTSDIQTTDYSEDGIRAAIEQHLHRYPNLCTNKAASGCWDPMFVLKVSNGARFQNMVDIMDEMAITGAQKYALADFTAEDSLLLAEYNLK